MGHRGRTSRGESLDSHYTREGTRPFRVGRVLRRPGTQIRKSRQFPWFDTVCVYVDVCLCLSLVRRRLLEILERSTSVERERTIGVSFTTVGTVFVEVNTEAEGVSSEETGTET